MQNFWENKNWEFEDKHLIDMKEMPFRRLFPDVNLRPGLYSIRGPRQIGKSSWIKTLLSKVTKESSANKVFYMSCENLSDHRDLAEVLNTYKKTRDFIFLDEVTFVKEWSRPIKQILDEGYKGVVVVTGSNLLDLRSGVDRMPGREGFGQDLFLLPMDFHEYQKARKEAGWISENRTDELKKYFRVGGFPLAVAEAGKSGIKTTKTEKIIEKWILGDIARIGKNENYIKELMSQSVQTLSSQMSTQKLAQRTQIGSHHTVADYIQTLEDMFVMRTLYSIDPNTGALRFKKEKKYYLNDPIYVRLGLRWLGLNNSEVEESTLAEMAAHEYLQRKYNRIGFLSSASGGEVDFFAYKKWAIEVKWSEQITGLSKTYKNLNLPFKCVWNQENFFLNEPDI